MFSFWLYSMYFVQFFQLDGCPVDAASYAAFAALHTARYPKIELIEGESGKPEDFELSSDIASAMKLPLSVDGVPVIVTIAEVFNINTEPSKLYNCYSKKLTSPIDWIKYCCRLRFL